jgi:hypothetical protein
MRIFERWYFWLVLKLEISYRVIIISWRIWVCFLEDFLKIIFWHGEIFEFVFHNSSFALRYILLKSKWQGHTVCDIPLIYLFIYLLERFFFSPPENFQCLTW